MNGYKNYETWTISLWDWFEPMALSAIDQGELQVDARWCEDWLEEALEIYDYQKGIIGDWVNASFGEVDFREVAEHVNDTILDIGI
ncbi:hypothetical protein [Pseudoalteromonas sp.]|uniref:hypothetical protein n=1 Tax=Pseudoalteromonas sp. TaxID=53249 RepID=UPI0026229256|nr:hypothetical protein [Pseudoalteromonas sp.]MCP4586181.1 hypothetical protein [Pseudoalteromonas sp.]